jgi:hypothetical protein
MNIDEIIKHLDLIPLPEEGGYYRETYRSDFIIEKAQLNGGIGERRSIYTCIYYLITDGIFSALHRLPADEIWHFYLGDPIEQLQLFPDDTGKIIEIGNDFHRGQVPQILVPKKVWQGSRLKDGGKFALVGTTTSPGFEFEDYQDGDRDELMRQYPGFSTLINQLTYP